MYVAQVLVFGSRKIALREAAQPWLTTNILNLYPTPLLQTQVPVTIVLLKQALVKALEISDLIRG